jgi:CheY-like chemotaxis protein
MKAVLEKAGYWSVSINDPTRLESTIEIERPHLILMDVVMPLRNGFQACRELKGRVEFSHIPVVLVTSKSTASDKFWAQQQGADGFVTKPFTPEQLLSAVQKFV